MSCHDIAAIWVAFFSRWQRYRCSQDSCPPSLELDDTEPGGGEAAVAAGAEREREQAQSPGSTEMAQHLCEPSFPSTLAELLAVAHSFCRLGLQT